MKRRLLYFILGFIAIIFVVLQFRSSYKLKPNIFLVVSNVNNVRLLGYSDSYLVPTTNLDRLTREGIEFKNCFGVGSTADEIVRGLFVNQGGVSNSVIGSDSDINIITNRFYNLGYQIAVIGDWPISIQRTKGYYYIHSKSNKNIAGVVKSKECSNIWSSVDVFTTKVNEFLRIREKSKPFLILLYQNLDKNKIDEYEPYNLKVCSSNNANFKTKSLSKLNTNGFFELSNFNPYSNGNFGFESRNYSTMVRNYFASILSIDLNLGQVIQSLKENNELDNTILISALIKQNDFNLELDNVTKGFSHINLTIRYPDKIKAGIKSDAICLSTDLYPTIFDLCNEDIPDEIQPNSLLPIIRNDGSQPAGWRNFVYFENHDKYGNKYTGISTKRYKLINEYELDKWELYDLQIDPLEKNNVYYFSHYCNVKDSLMGLLVNCKKKKYSF